MSWSAMYSSCSSAQRSPSSRGIDWFWPSGSSVTIKVDRVDRATTSVWTFRLPWRVGRAFGIEAASSLSSSGLGLSMTRAAVGSLNSILAKRALLSSRTRDAAILPARRQANHEADHDAGGAVQSPKPVDRALGAL